MSAEGIPTEWYFVTAPQEVSWSKDSVTKEIDTYGTNNPYFNYGTTKLRKLSLSNAMIEGFSDSKQVENNVVSLEACMRMIIDEGTGYASPYCWKVYAGDKSYGTFLITSVNVREEMRDMSGKATRAIVDVELQEVPPYQVASGTDITSTAAFGGIDPEVQKQLASEASSQDSKVSSAKASSGKSSSSTNASASAEGAGGGEEFQAGTESYINPLTGAATNKPVNFNNSDNTTRPV